MPERIPCVTFKASLSEQMATYAGSPVYLPDLVPGLILEVLAERGFKYTIKELPFWKDWEYGKTELEDARFINEVLGALAGSDQDVILLCDDCFKTGVVYKLPVPDLFSLRDQAEFGDTLFEPFDHLFYFPQSHILVMVHHEGRVITANLAGDRDAHNQV